jgi:diguanylate cyclase (GGDEF)-like protein
LSNDDTHLRPGDEHPPRGEFSSGIGPKEDAGPKIRHFGNSLAGKAASEYRYAIARDLLKLSLLLGALLLSITLGFVLFLRWGDVPIIYVSCLAYAIVVVLYFSRPMPPQGLYGFFIAVLSLVGSFLIADHGNVSAGLAWFCATVAVASIFYGIKGGIAICAAETAILAAIGIAQYARLLSWHEDSLTYLITSIDAVGLGVFVSIAQTRLIVSLDSSMDARGRLTSELGEWQAELAREAAIRHNAELRADFLESHDPLTRLLNRDSFEIELAKAVEVAAARGRILGIMSVGIDRLHRVAEAHGPEGADTVLAEAAARLAHSFRDDDIVARHGGDDFLVLLSDVKNPEDAKAIIDKSKQAFDRSFPVQGSEIGLSASFGLALYPNDGKRADMLIRASEVALHLAKDDGPGSYRLYDAALHARLIERSRIEHELLGALHSGAFIPWYQPKVDGRGRIVGAEALARWQLPEGGIRLPADFIDAAERTGFIDDLGRNMLAQACANAAAWARAGLDPVPVSVNLSPFQFRNDGLVMDVRSILIATGLSPSRLDLEITESGIMEDQSRAIEKLAEFKALGCSISIDDFGTGYSSFATLRDFPVDNVKLPQSFVEPLPGDARASTIASAVIDLAHRLHFSVVAEGVENTAQFGWLGMARCDQYQGFLFSPPIPELDFEHALARGFYTALE